jgi:prepilin-type N-terminal cleavage/methylation domain-containing protein/prepilin-type processing-associated H-X9-DG protein
MNEHISFRRIDTGFTLIELLVVISIISLLVALLLPALNKSRKAAENLRCQTNIRQITAASFAYATDMKGNLPARYVTATGYGTSGMMLYTRNIESYYTRVDGAPYTSVNPNPAWACPTSPVQPGLTLNAAMSSYVPNVALGNNANPLQRDYQHFNSAAVPTREKYYPRIDEIMVTSKTVLYGEGQGRYTSNTWRTNTEFYTFTRIGAATAAASYDVNPTPASGFYGEGMSYTPGYWHGAVAQFHTAYTYYRPDAWGNFAWTDGHVSTIKPSEGKDAWLVRGAHPGKN